MEFSWQHYYTNRRKAARHHSARQSWQRDTRDSFLALGLLLALCLISAAFYPNDPSWNSPGQTETQNWAGSIGANVAATAFQFIGLAAYLLPLLLFAAAWRRFRTRTRFISPWTRIVGLVVLVVAASALLSISQMRPLFDSSVQPGGLLGAVVAQGLASGLSNVGATVSARRDRRHRIAARDQFLLRSTLRNHRNAIGTRFAFVGKLPERFRAWRQRARTSARKKRNKGRDQSRTRSSRKRVKQHLNLNAR